MFGMVWRVELNTQFKMFFKKIIIKGRQLFHMYSKLSMNFTEEFKVDERTIIGMRTLCSAQLPL